MNVTINNLVKYYDFSTLQMLRLMLLDGIRCELVPSHINNELFKILKKVNRSLEIIGDL
jgi:hypothetical protein